MIEITFLGTGCMQPTKTRNHAGVLLSYHQENILFDCGEGIQRQMRIVGIKPAKITRLCISHWHGDHVFGIPGLLSSMGADQYAKKLFIYGPVGSKNFLQHLLQGFAAKDIIEHEVHEIKNGIFFENDEFSLYAHSLKHSTPCIGFRFHEKDKRRINVAKATKLGLKEGPILGKIQMGKSVIVNGRKVNPNDLSSVVKGRNISYVTDTIECQGVDLLAQETDLLIIEGTLLDELREHALKSKHLTVKQAALIAASNNAKKVVITHLSQRYKTSSEIKEEAQQYFSELIVAEDFMKIRI
ncbi:ribonuclease Z [Candidatus Woesearchaeota archaeon]|nr:ribonuclease Z [Candidatus Woesearchaeota archaeon]